MVVGVSGATGVIYAVRLLHGLRQFGVESQLGVTKLGEVTLAYETDLAIRDLRGKLPLRASLARIFPAELQAKVLADWPAYDYPSSTTQVPA